MHIRRGWARHVAAGAVLCGWVWFDGCGLTAPDLDAEEAAANRAVAAWLEHYPDEWSVSLSTDAPPTRAEWSPACADHPPTGRTAFRCTASQTDILLFFRCPLDSLDRAEDLNAAFAYAVLQTLPHGIRSKGWEFSVLTPSSSIEEGVVFSTLPGERMQVSIDTPLFAVYGHSVRPPCQPAVDGPSPEGCYLQREHRVPLHLRLAAPFSAAAMQ